MAENGSSDKSAWALKPKDSSAAGTPASNKPVSRGNSWGTPAPAAPRPAAPPPPEPEDDEYEEVEEYEELEVEEDYGEEEEEEAPEIPTAPEPAPKLRVKRRETTDVNAYNPVVERYPEKPPVDYSKYVKTAMKVIAGAVVALVVALTGLAFFPLGESTDAEAFGKALDYIEELNTKFDRGEIADIASMQNILELSRGIRENPSNREAMAALRAVYAMGHLQAGRINQGRPVAEFVAQSYADTQYGDLCNVSGIVRGLEIDRVKAREAYSEVLQAAPTSIRTVYVRLAARQRLINIQQKIRFWE